MDNRIILITEKDKKNEFTTINEIKIDLPKSTLGSISKYRFYIENEKIYLQRYCNNCKKFFNVKTLIDTTLVVVDNCAFTPIGKGSNFETICINCKNTNKSYPDLSIMSDNIQLNVKTNKELKRFYQLLSIENDTSLSAEVTKALLFYKSHIKKSNKN